MLWRRIRVKLFVGVPLLGNGTDHFILLLPQRFQVFQLFATNLEFVFERLNPAINSSLSIRQAIDGGDVDGHTQHSESIG